MCMRNETLHCRHTRVEGSIDPIASPERHDRHHHDDEERHVEGSQAMVTHTH
jgi:hypothetical protein